MIRLEGVSKSYGPKVLFEGVDWLVTPQDRIGLVGPNGSGKTTLLKILAGLESPDQGTVVAAKGVSRGYLPQEGLALAGRTVFEECLGVFDDLRQMGRELESLSRLMAELDPAGDAYREAAERFARLDAEFRQRDGYAIEARVGAVLAGLGFAKRDWVRRTEEFSGGWQARIALAKLLLARPNLLLLDEPTNHLDLEARNWLEDYLASYPHAFVLVSHDRYFLDVTVNRIVEIWNRRLHFYPGNYSRYLEARRQRIEQLEAAARQQQERIRQLETFINRFRYTASRARQVQSRIKELEKLQRIEVPPEEPQIRLRFPQPRPSGRLVAEARDLGKKYGDQVVFRGVHFTIERGDRVALVGPNGAGKSTLIRMLAGLEPPSEGELRLGHNVEPDYFAQDQYKELDPEARLLDDLSALAPRATQTELRTLLGCFLFSEDDVFKPIGVLSGGERNRYALARLLVRPSNFLLLDEPTNHLDLRAKDVLLDALRQYQGTLVFVSHDRYFIDRLATRVFEVGGGRLETYPGNYEAYLWRKQQAAQAGAEKGPGSRKEAAAPAQTAPEEPAAPRPRRINPLRLRQMRERFEELEEEIARLEAEIAETERALAVYVSAEQMRELNERWKAQKSRLEAALAEWEQLGQAVEQAEAADVY
ncbi:MAG: ABC-F family ATP-binding cassette domain-containing protein [Bryobacterales bacterium]|nr:ABC-F family ATP-binding cassette domain-containing protein [Bryobacteraceae bacterium]MDW8129697.1 ABC-F family ATP-binding cassette domain-containing protein [Bryobacterales bacterium]